LADRIRINNHVYRRIASWRKEIQAMKYAERLRTAKTTYKDIQVKYVGGWYSVYGREQYAE